MHTISKQQKICNSKSDTDHADRQLMDMYRVDWVNFKLVDVFIDTINQQGDLPNTLYTDKTWQIKHKSKVYWLADDADLVQCHLLQLYNFHNQQIQ